MLKILKLPYLVFVICIDNLIVYFGYFAILPILAILLTQQQYSIDQVALASLVFIVALRSGRFFLGPFLDGVHPRPIMISGLLLAGISFMLIGFVSSYWMLLCCLCLIGLGQSANGLAGKSYISAMGAKDGNSLQYFSGLNVFVNIAAVFGPLFGTYMLTSGYQTYVFQIIGSFYLFTALVVLLLLRKFKMTGRHHRHQDSASLNVTNQYCRIGSMCDFFSLILWVGFAMHSCSWHCHIIFLCAMEQVTRWDCSIH